MRIINVPSLWEREDILRHRFLQKCQLSAGEGLPSQSLWAHRIFLLQEKDVTPDKNLLTKVQDAALWLESLSDAKPDKPSNSTTSSIADFFLALAICNSVMVSTTTEPRQRVRTSDSWG